MNDSRRVFHGRRCEYWYDGRVSIRMYVYLGRLFHELSERWTFDHLTNSTPFRHGFCYDMPPGS